jgi:hypothetical protein
MQDTLGEVMLSRDRRSRRPRPARMTGHWSALLLAPGVLVTCAGPERTPDAAPVADPSLPPWEAPSLPAAAVPPVYLEQWRQAENRSTCAAIAPGATGVEAQPRPASFSGGWGVAYDLAGLRGAFGVAGTAVEAGAPAYANWPHTRTWADGSSVGYGPEGGTGPNQLAYLRIQGQGCLYNLWSRLGLEHLEHLLEQLRFVEPEAPAALRRWKPDPPRDVRPT